MTSLKVRTSIDEILYFHSTEDDISVRDDEMEELGVRVYIGRVRVATFYRCHWYRFYTRKPSDPEA